MTTEILEERIQKLEARVENIENCAVRPNENQNTHKRGWRAFVGVDANNPDFEEVVRLGREWRFADSSADADDVETKTVVN